MAKSRRQRERDQILRVDHRVVDMVTAELRKVEQIACSPDWVQVEIRGGPYDGIVFPVPADQAGNADHWVFLPVTTKHPATGQAAYAWYQHRRGEAIADFWKTRLGDPDDLNRVDCGEGESDPATGGGG